MFITFEGPEGSGKTTQFQRVFAAMQAAGVAVLATREPGGTRIGEQVRDILLNRPEGAVMTAEAEALLFSAASILQNFVQIFNSLRGVTINIPPNLLIMVPYVLIIVVLVFARERKRVEPAALTKPFEREEG